mgnify:CR=1 FL=1
MTFQISIHTPAWGATDFTNFTKISGIFQSTLPRGERRLGSPPLQKKEGISIHTPAWGATPVNETIVIYRKISIHTPAWGATIVKAGVKYDD